MLPRWLRRNDRIKGSNMEQQPDVVESISRQHSRFVYCFRGLKRSSAFVRREVSSDQLRSFDRVELRPACRGREFTRSRARCIGARLFEVRAEIVNSRALFPRATKKYDPGEIFICGLFVTAPQRNHARQRRARLPCFPLRSSWYHGNEEEASQGGCDLSLAPSARTRRRERKAMAINSPVLDRTARYLLSLHVRGRPAVCVRAYVCEPRRN